jgi:hypothetical protein
MRYACLREAPPTKALCGGQALRRRQALCALRLGVLDGLSLFSWVYPLYQGEEF